MVFALTKYICRLGRSRAVSELPAHRSSAHYREMLNERFRRKIMERAMETVILEAQQQLMKENQNVERIAEDSDSIYVICESNSGKIHQIPEQEENFYMSMT